MGHQHLAYAPNRRSRCSAGDTVVFRLPFTCTLGPGSYSVSPALVSTDTHLTDNYEWVDNLLVFDVLNVDRQIFHRQQLARRAIFDFPRHGGTSRMSFISYAQNFEDVMLWRALRHVEAGTYVDVGAQHPLVDSVSKAFYERGWRGTHIEPVPAFADLLRHDRPDETVLQVALGAAEGTLALNVIADTGLSTAVAEHAQRHRDERGMQASRIEVPVLTLRSALQALVGKEIHWLKIDVEGYEEQVLRGWDSRVLRPWVMVVEATVPGSPAVDCAGWDPILVAANYRFVYFDGLNRFYVAAEHAELAAAFAVPPNVFDQVELSGLSTIDPVPRRHRQVPG